jgi:ribosomal protein S18 acetylase RimI-like enzyme
MNDNIIEINHTYLSEALSLVWSVFLEFEAPEYCEEGVAEFKRYIEPDAIRERLYRDELKMWICLNEDSVVGIIAMRPPCHISLLFVDKHFHHQGIARALFEHVLESVKAEGKHKEMTVYSSPYAAGFYRKVGFIDTDTEQTVNGIRFIPMKQSVDALYSNTID